jgi:hypothetical protein
MKSVFLFPAKFKIIGWIFLIPSVIVGLFMLFDSELELKGLDWIIPWSGSKDNLTNELVMLVVLVFAVLVAFTKTKEEDEYVQKIRLDSLVWSVYMNYAILFIGIIGFYNFDFLNLLVFNMYTPLFIFIARFQYYYNRR